MPSSARVRLLRGRSVARLASCAGLLLAAGLAAAAAAVSTPPAAANPAPASAPDAARPVPRTLVFGGTGMIGGEIVRELRARGVPVTVFVRPTSSRAKLEPLGVEFVTGDVEDAATVAAAFRGRRFDVVVSSIARTDNDTPTNGVTIYATGNDRITAAARAAGVVQLVQVGTVGAGDSARLVPPKIYEFARQVFEDKTRAERTLQASGLRYTIVRTGILIGGTATGTGRLSEDQGLLQPMTVADIAREVAACVGAPRCYDRIYHTADPALAGLGEAEISVAKQKLRVYKEAGRAVR